MCACIALCVVCKTKEHTVSHLTLKKDNNLKDHLVEVAGDSDGLDDEFKQLEEVASNEVMEKTIETNIAHNRYNDIREYTFDLNLLVPRGLGTRSENTITNNKI